MVSTRKKVVKRKAATKKLVETKSIVRKLGTVAKMVLRSVVRKPVVHEIPRGSNGKFTPHDKTKVYNQKRGKDGKFISLH